MPAKVWNGSAWVAATVHIYVGDTYTGGYTSYGGWVVPDIKHYIDDTYTDTYTDTYGGWV